MLPPGEATSADRGITPETAGLVPPTHERLRFANKVAIITGSSHFDGIGAATARALARGGAQGIVITGSERSIESAQAVAKEIEELGTNPLVLTEDISDPEAPQRLVAATLEQFGGAHIAINCAGITRDGGIVKMEQGQWNDVMDTNLRPAFLMTQELLRQGAFSDGGVIVNVSSVSGVYGQYNQSNYSAAKAGLIGLTKSQAKELGPRGIRVNAVAPGLVATELTRDMTDKAVIKGATEALTPLRRLGTPEDVAAAIDFLASDDASFITGQVLEVDGGLDGMFGALEALVKTQLRLDAADQRVARLKAQQ